MKIVGTQLARMAILVLLAAFGSAMLVRFSPGALVDERELDPRLSAGTLAAMRAQREAENSLGQGFVRYVRGALHGDLGQSQTNGAAIADLLKNNAAATLKRVVTGLAGAWLLGLALAIPVAAYRRAWVLDTATALFAGLLLSLPAGVLALLCLTFGAPVELVLLLVLTPRIFRYSRNVLAQAYGAPCIDMARARGIGELRILSAYVMRGAAPQLLALLATSLSMAIGSIIPIEAICDAAGLGRLAWQAATARDLPLLLNLTMLIALATTAGMTVAELAARPRLEAAQ
ncbi:ABC transporter permease subunit [Paludibaculum fermentans]|uniref:ABC transporter permease subunit n=1 Tax=Paludibaculum fermentans TaxID=1473598 RepID=UPI003EC1498D